MIGLAVAAAFLASASVADSHAVRVNVDNFIRAETDLYFGHAVKDGGVGNFFHRREAMPVSAQTVIRANRDTFYSTSVFDLDAGPVTVTLPEAGGRFMAMQVIDQDQYTPRVIYSPGEYTFTRDDVGTRYVLLGIRTFVNPEDAADVREVHALQDAIRVSQPGGPGRFEVPRYDKATQDKVRNALLTLAEDLPDVRRAFGARGKVDPVRRLIGAASAWGGNPDQDATYLNVTPPLNDGRTVYRLHVGKVPVDGFWSVSLYNAKGYYEPNPLNAYSLNNVTAKRGSDGSVEIQFGGCESGVANCLPTMPGWNYMVRLYRPRPEILNGSWKFPEARPVEDRAASR